jgi:hypothetical protein
MLMSGLGQVDSSRKNHSPILFSSTDGGKTWAMKSVLAFSEEGKVLTEFSFVNTAGAKWVALIRDETNPCPRLRALSDE